MDTMESDLSEWILAEIDKRGWSLRQLARRAELSHSVVASVANGTSNAGLEVCMGLARAMHTPLEEIFRLAGILPPRRTISESHAAYRINDEARLLDLYRELPENDKGLVIDLVERLTGRTVARIVGPEDPDAKG
jgi:transcriptional regulator with XRE-family HTH domain